MGDDSISILTNSRFWTAQTRAPRQPGRWRLP